MKNLGTEYANLNIESNLEILETLSLRKEIFLTGKTDYYLAKLMVRRKMLSEAISKASIIPYVTKYLVEAGFLFGMVLLGIGSLIVKDKASFLISLTVFLAVGARMTPAVLRIQQGLLVMKNNFTIAESAVALCTNLNESSENCHVSNQLPKTDLLVADSFIPEIEFKSVSFSFEGKGKILNGINLTIQPYTFSAIAGPSGAGKSTLVSLLLGFLVPQEGYILVSGLKPSNVFKLFPGKISYVPQDVNLISGSLAENIALGVSFEEINFSKLDDVLKKTSLTSYVNSLPHGLRTQVGELGVTMSGGQRQRIGIARALYTEPCLLILDEATSSLDGSVESDVIGELAQLKSNMSIVVIAHRLSAVRDADQIIYIDGNGHNSSGKFSELRKNIPDFDNQARQLGL
jgi:ABC-type multidrug transport system fused ATPase/permease subunit